MFVGGDWRVVDWDKKTLSAITMFSEIRKVSEATGGPHLQHGN